MAPNLLVQPDSEHGLEAEPELLFGILLSWVGNTFFAHEALRRSPIKGVGVLLLVNPVLFIRLTKVTKPRSIALKALKF